MLRTLLFFVRGRGFVLLASLLLASSLSGATFVVPSDRYLVQDATAIVVASALSSRTELRDGKAIETITVMSIEEVLKGHVKGDTFEVYEPGGSYERRTTLIPGVPRFKDGDRYLLFLVKGGGVWRVLNLALGKFSFDTDISGHELVLRDSSEIVGWDADRSIHRERRRLAEPFLQFIRTTVGGGPAKEDYEAPVEPLIRDSAPPQVFSTRHLKPVPLFTANSYSYIYSGSSGARWVEFPSAVPFYSVSTEPQASNGGVDAINTAMGSWNNDMLSNVNLSYTGADNSGMHNGGVTTPDGQNTIAFEQDLMACCGASPLPCSSSSYGPGLLGVAGVTNDSGPHIGPNGETFFTSREGDVQMNKLASSGCTFYFTSGDFNSALTHELGHTLGFRHSDENRVLFGGACASPNDCSSNAIMKAFIPSLKMAMLQTWDQSAVDAVYPNFSGTAPTGLVATAATSTSVSVTWNTTGAPSYHVYRTSNGINWVQLTPTAGTSITDSSMVSANTAYLYKVRAFNGTVESSDSNIDLATTVMFTNSLTPQVSTIAAVDFTQVRTAVNAVQTLAGIANTAYTDPTLDSTVTVKKVHIDEPLTRLNTARTTLGLMTISLSGGAITAQVTLIRASDITDLRAGTQ